MHRNLGATILMSKFRDIYSTFSSEISVIYLYITLLSFFYPILLKIRDSYSRLSYIFNKIIYILYNFIFGGLNNTLWCSGVTSVSTSRNNFWWAWETMWDGQSWAKSICVLFLWPPNNMVFNFLEKCAFNPWLK